MMRRYVHGAGVDEALVWYEGTDTSDRRFLVSDERGSIVAVTDSSGNVSNVNTYDSYGEQGAGNTGRFQYTGQAYYAEVGLYYYKARWYNADLGRFMQTDPIGYGDGMNMYAYVGGDPVNGIDPSGLITVTFDEIPSNHDCLQDSTPEDCYSGEFIGTVRLGTPYGAGDPLATLSIPVTALNVHRLEELVNMPGEGLPFGGQYLEAPATVEPGLSRTSCQTLLFFGNNSRSAAHYMQQFGAATTLAAAPAFLTGPFTEGAGYAAATAMVGVGSAAAALSAPVDLAGVVWQGMASGSVSEARTAIGNWFVGEVQGGFVDRFWGGYNEGVQDVGIRVDLW